MRVIGDPNMGEIRVQVRLTNAADESLMRRGQLAEDKVRIYVADALVDTGAIRCVVPEHVLHKLGAGTRGQRVAEYADGRREAVPISEALIVEILGRDTMEDAMVVSLENMTRIDPSILELSELPLGWRAIRRSPDEPWEFEPNPKYET